jgi:hypothetical protein
MAIALQGLQFWKRMLVLRAAYGCYRDNEVWPSTILVGNRVLHNLIYILRTSVFQKSPMSQPSGRLAWYFTGGAGIDGAGALAPEKMYTLCLLFALATTNDS